MQAQTLWLWEKCTVIPHLARWNCGGKESSNFASLEFKGVQKMIQKSPAAGVSFFPAHHLSLAGMSALSGLPLHEQSQGLLAHQLRQQHTSSRSHSGCGCCSTQHGRQESPLSTSLWIPMGHRCFHWNFYGHRNWVDIKNYPKGEIRKSIVVFIMCLFFWQDADWALHAPEAQKLVTWPQWTHHHISFQIILITFL